MTFDLSSVFGNYLMDSLLKSEGTGSLGFWFVCLYKCMILSVVVGFTGNKILYRFAVEQTH